MLRSKVSQRGLAQLTSLLEWQHSRVLGPCLLQQQRTFAARDDSVKFAKDRKSFEDKLSQLRKQWARQRVEQLARKAAAEEAERQKREAAKAARAQQDAAAKEARLQQLRERQAAERELRAQAKIARLKRHTLRQEVLDVALEERRQLLVDQSKNWITADTLDMRIKEALDHPVPLFGSASTGPQPSAPAAVAAEAAAPPVGAPTS